MMYRTVGFSNFMAAISNFTRENALLSRLKFKALVYLQKVKRPFAEFERQHRVSADSGQIDFSQWRKLDSRNFGITRSMIPSSPLVVLKILHNEGFEAYLVGGCVRDLILNRIPKDFDIITNARLQQIKKQFHHCEIVGQTFPICKVRVKGSTVEVSSFDTVAKHAEKEEEPFVPKMPKGCPQKDLILWKNSMCRDFTINSLFFNPFVNRIYDYANAMQDLQLLKLRTLVPAHLSFGEDCARILRGLRLAARLNLSFTKEIEDAMRELSSSIMSLSKYRLMMELNYMMSYGAAEPSLSLLQRYNILEIVLPFHGAYLAQQASKQLGKSSVMLMKLFSSLDQLVTCVQPSHDSVWVALLAFHMALITHPQHAFVILTFASVLYRANWKEAVKFAEKHSEDATFYGPEFSDSQGSISDDELAKKVAQLAVQVQKSINILTDRDSLLEAMSRFPGVPCSGLVFVPDRIGRAVEFIFDILVKDVTSLQIRENIYKIDYYSLKKGRMHETRFILGKVILDTIVPEVTQSVKVIRKEKHMLFEVDGQQKEGAFLDLELMKPEFVSDDANLRNENYQLQHNISEKKKLNHEGCSELLEVLTKKQKTVAAAELSEEAAVKKQDLIVTKKKTIKEQDLIVTKKKTKGDLPQLPRDATRMLLEEVKLHEGCSELLEVVTKKQKTVAAAELSEEVAVKKQDLIVTKKKPIKKQDLIVTKKKTKGDLPQLPRDATRMLLEEVKLHEGCSELLEVLTKKQKTVPAAELSEEVADKKQDLIVTKKKTIKKQDLIVTKKKTKGDLPQSPRDATRMLLEEVKHKQHCRDATGKEKKNKEKFTNLLMNNVATKDHKFTENHDSLLQEHSIDKVNEKLDGKNHDSAEKVKQTVCNPTLSALFR